MIHHVPLAGTAGSAGGGARVAFLKLVLCPSTALDFARGGSGTTDALRSGGMDLSSTRHPLRMVACGRPACMRSTSRHSRHDGKRQRNKENKEGFHLNRSFATTE